MTFRFSQRSLDRLKGVHPDLVSVMQLAILKSPVDFTVLEGVRSVERQKKLVASGASKTMNSRHLTGHAVDVAPLLDGEVSWDWPMYHQLAPAIKDAARELGVSIEWGGDWSSFKDGPHWQLSWGVYGKDDMLTRARKPFVPPTPPAEGFVRPDAPVAPPAREVPPAGLWAGLVGIFMAIFGKGKQ